MTVTLRLFISYSSQDKDLAIRLWRDLREQGVVVWQNDESAVPGLDAWDPILRQIEDSDFFVVLVSAAAVASKAVREEIDHAHYSRINSRSQTPIIIPVILDSSTEVPPKIIRFGRIDMSDGDYEHKLALLLRTIGIRPTDRQPSDAEQRHIIQPGVGLQAVRIGDPKEAMSREFGSPSKDDGEYVCFYEQGISAVIRNDRIKTLFFYFRTPGYTTFDGRTEDGIQFTSKVSDVLKRYREPDRFSQSIISEFGVKPGALDFYLPYGKKGIAFSFYDDELADVRIFTARSTS